MSLPHITGETVRRRLAYRKEFKLHCWRGVGSGSIRPPVSVKRDYHRAVMGFNHTVSGGSGGMIRPQI